MRPEQPLLNRLKHLGVVSVLASSLVLGSAMVVPLQAEAQSLQAARFYNEGLAQYQQGNVNDAIKYFLQAAKADPSYPDSYFNLGTIYYHQNQHTNAAKAFLRVVKLSPSDDQAKFNLAMSFEKLNKLDSAVKVLKAIKPTDSKYQEAQEKLNQISHAMQQQQQKSADPVYTVRPVKHAVDTFASGFAGPTGIAVGGDGALFVANYSKHVVYRVDKLGHKSVFAESQGLNGPVGMVYHPRRNEFYVANYLGNSISRINAKGEVSELASGLKKPYYLILDEQHDALFVSEQESNTVSRIQL